MTFGIEMELLLKPKPTIYSDLKRHGFDPAVQPTHTDQNRVAAKRNQDAVRKLLAEAMNKVDIKTKFEGSDYDVWTVKEESSLSEVADARGGGYCAAPFLPIVDIVKPY
jgi:hypothetical protein